VAELVAFMKHRDSCDNVNAENNEHWLKVDCGISGYALLTNKDT